MRTKEEALNKKYAKNKQPVRNGYDNKKDGSPRDNKAREQEKRGRL